MTDNEPPREVAPVPTVKVLEPETEVLPLRVTPPVPVEKVPVPDCEILPNVWLILLLKVEAPVTPRVEERVVAPVTERVLFKDVASVTPRVPAIVTFPPKDPVPVPVENVPVPDWVKLPKV